jgi:SAM-dependent methyltransferase
MVPDAPLGPHARALTAYHAGRTNALPEIRTDQGEPVEECPVEVFFRTELYPFEQVAIDRCRGRVLDFGAAVGVHSLILQERGFEVTAVEIMPGVAEIARQRGVQDVRTARESGRYPGKAWVQLSFDGKEGAPFRELYIDSDTARSHAEAAGWELEVLQEEGGGYTAMLTRRDG